MNYIKDQVVKFTPTITTFINIYDCGPSKIVLLQVEITGIKKCIRESLKQKVTGSVTLLQNFTGQKYFPNHYNNQKLCAYILTIKN